MEDYDKTKSRKWKLVLLVVLIAAIGTIIPPLISAWVFKAATPLIILTGTEFVSLITLVVSAYMGANILQKHSYNKTGAGIKIEAQATVETNEEGEA